MRATFWIWLFVSCITSIRPYRQRGQRESPGVSDKIINLCAKFLVQNRNIVVPFGLVEITGDRGAQFVFVGEFGNGESAALLAAEWQTWFVEFKLTGLLVDQEYVAMQASTYECIYIYEIWIIGEGAMQTENEDVPYLLVDQIQRMPIKWFLSQQQRLGCFQPASGATNWTNCQNFIFFKIKPFLREAAVPSLLIFFAIF